MKLNVLIFKNIKIDAFTTPNFSDLDPEVAAVQLQRALVLNQNKKEYIDPYRNLDMYCIGSFDDVSGKFEITEPRLLCSPREIILSLEAEQVKKMQAIIEEKKKKEAEVSEVVNV